jgi:hypothetical protein
MVTTIFRAGAVAMVLSLLVTSHASAECWQCVNTGGACPYTCTLAPPGQGFADCYVGSCGNYCTLGHSCSPFGPQGIAADGTAIEELSLNRYSLLLRAPAVARPGFFAAFELMAATERRNCQGMIVDRAMSTVRSDEIRLHARRIAV